MVVGWFFWHRFQFVVAAYLVAAAFSIPATTSAARADDLDVLHSQILQHPNNPELNLRFAQLAETSGYMRWALATYERMLITDPNNPEAQQGLVRVQQSLKPDTTLLTVQVGGQYESNPRYYIPPRTPEMEALGSVALLDERNLSGMRWRTNVVAAGMLHAREGDLTYGVAGLDTGPVLAAMPGWTFHPAIGGNVGYFDRHFYYGEGAVSGLFESNMNNMYRSLLVRGAYRSYDDFFPSGQGAYVEVRGKLAVPGALGPDTAAVVSPWMVWSNINGSASVVTPIVTDLQPGAYVEWGGRVDLLRTLTSWLVVGLNMSAVQRDYRTDVVVASLDKRRDTLLIPGAQLIFPNLLAYGTDLRLDYRFIDDHSNDQTKRFTDHIVSATFVSRFDPTAPPPWASTTDNPKR
jgi:hypothetical protein